jgi:hypothetical protein
VRVVLGWEVQGRKVQGKEVQGWEVQGRVVQDIVGARVLVRPCSCSRVILVVSETFRLLFKCAAIPPPPAKQQLRNWNLAAVSLPYAVLCSGNADLGALGVPLVPDHPGRLPKKARLTDIWPRVGFVARRRLTLKVTTVGRTPEVKRASAVPPLAPRRYHQLSSIRCEMRGR